jgi:hypothetical protein
MADTSQQRATKSYRKRLGQRGISRFEVIGRKDDRELIRTVAKRLSEKSTDAARLRAEINKSLAASSVGTRGGIYAALRRSPLVGVDVDLERVPTPPRKIEL